MLYEHEGLTDAVSHLPRLRGELRTPAPRVATAPNRARVAHVFNQEFDGMTIETVSLDELLDVR
ncbi:hypothetical protein LJR245_007502 [Rhizobium leguminosarum]|uniref:hypothetical protein n=1 Tax=Rhizobium leguminosarum TaxID=384 RepID=UPI003ED0D716